METFPIQVNWLEIKKALQMGFGPESSLIQRWLGMIRFLGQEGETILLGVPNRFVLEWIEKKYLSGIEEILKQNFNRPVQVRLRVDADLFQELRRAQDQILGSTMRQDSPLDSMALGVGQAKQPPSPGVPGPRSDGEQAERAVRTPYTLSSFVTGSNQAIVAVIKQVVNSPGRVFNPLFIYGPTGVGKTHLLQGLHQEFLKSGKQIRSRYYEGERFLNHFILSLKDGTIQKFRDQIRSSEVFILDDFQLLINKQKTQEEFLHTFDALLNSGSQVILASTQPPRNLTAMKETLVSRLLSGLVVALQNPDFETRLEIIRHYSGKLSLRLDDDVQTYIAENVRGNVREIIGALNLVSAHDRLCSSLPGPVQPVDRQKIRQLLEGLVRESGKRLQLDHIVKATSQYYQISEEMIRSKNRDRTVALARQVAIFLGRSYTGHSLTEIGNFFGNRNFSTVRASEMKIRNRLEADAPLRRDLQAIQRILESD